MNIGEQVFHLPSGRTGIITARSTSCPFHTIVKFSNSEELLPNEVLEIVTNIQIDPMEVEQHLNSFLEVEKIGIKIASLLGTKDSVVFASWIPYIGKMELSYRSGNSKKATLDECLEILSELEDSFS